MNIITVNNENLDNEHICCAISNNKDCQVSSKKAWLAERFDEGLVFKKGDVRGKCFIEYIPAEMAWAPIKADGYMYIDCLWVSGKFQGQGSAGILLDECVKDSRQQGKKGIVVLSSKKKMPFLSDPKFLKYKGFKTCDSAEPYYELLYFPFEDSYEAPSFKEQVKNHDILKEKGFVLFYAHQCPFSAKYVPLIEKQAAEKKIPFKSVRFETREQAQNSLSPFTSYSLFYNGEFVTHEILSEKKFEKIIGELGL